MEFTFTTQYDLNACIAMAKGVRKTTRTKRSRRAHIIGWILVILVALLSLPTRGEAYAITSNRIVSWIAALAIIVVFCFEDRINGAIAKRRTLPGLISSTTTFREDGYYSETEVGTSQFKYDNILAIAESDRYFIFVFSQNHAQVYDKSSLSGGDTAGFCAMIEEKTGCKIQKI
ncbi:MAG: YcxB family protein [Oscillospiraceae bacterium]|nr:YcxB family protein [Oscillospiraceae bacterium]